MNLWNGTCKAQACMPPIFAAMMNRALLFLFTATFTTLAIAQEAPRRTIEVHIAGAANDTIYLANYYGNKLFYNDTTVADAKGRAVFNSDRGYKAGVYAVVVPGPKYFEIIVNEPRIVLATDKSDLMGKLQVRESKENEVFSKYVITLNERRKEGDALRKQQEATEDPIAKGTLMAQLDELDRSVKAYQRDLIAQHKGLFAADLVRMSLAVELPEPRKEDGTLDSAAAYYQYRRHFWDHFDLSDDRIVRAPVYANKLEEYLTRTIPQTVDTIARLVDELVARTESSEEVFKYTVHTITHKFETSDIMGMDAMFVHMALTYYCPAPGRASRAFWMEDETLEKLCERARKMDPLTLGKAAKNLILTDTTEQRWIGFHDLPQEYVMIVFWDPHCGVCKKELPEIHKVYKEHLKDMGVEVFAVAKAVDEGLMRDWKKFIRENDLDWVNVGLTRNVYEQAKKDPRQFIPRHTTIESLNYAETYDVYSTPKMFVVDKERKIVAKQLTAEQVVDLVNKLREIERLKK